MKKTILTTLLFVGLLVGCSKPNSSVSDSGNNTPSDSASESVSETPTESESDTEELPVIPDDSSEPGGNQSTAGKTTIEGAIPAGWTYITNDPKYPDTDWYGDGGLKLNFVNMGLKSPVFETAVKTVVLEGKLNGNTKTDGAKTTLSVYTISGSKETLVRSAVFSAANLTTYSESYSLPSGTTQFVIKLTGIVGYNVNLKTITVS